MASIRLPTAYWSMEESSGQRNDAVGANHLVESFATINSRSGRVGNGADIVPGGFSLLKIANNATIVTGDRDWTYNFWVNADSLGAFQFFANKGYSEGASNREWIVSKTGAGNPLALDVFFGAAGSARVTNTSGGEPVTSTFYMITILHDSVNNLIGIQLNAGTRDTTSHPDGVNSGNQDLEFGGSVGVGTYFDGLFDETGWWAGMVLTTAEVTWLYNAGAGRSYADILADQTPNLSALGGSFPIRRTYRPGPFKPGIAR